MRTPPRVFGGEADEDLEVGVILIATDEGLVVCQHNEAGNWQRLYRGLEGRSVTSVIAREGVILAGTTGGVFRSDDLGKTWREASAGLPTRHIRWMAYHPEQSDFELAGSEPAGIFISRDGGENWRECPEVAEMRHRFRWYLPYSPEAGCVRGFAHHGNRAYAAVEVGGVLTSEDGGETWRLAQGSSGEPHSSQPPFVHPDVHSIAVHASSEDWVYAPTGGGFYRSKDGGATWELLYRCYCRAVWIDPEDRNHIVLGPADNVDHNGRIEQSLDGGQTWQPASAGLNAPWRRHMVERFTQAGGELLAVLSNGSILSSSIGGLDWKEPLPEVRGAAAIASMDAGGTHAGDYSH